MAYDNTGIGKFDRKIIIQYSYYLSKGDTGEQKKAWTEFAQAWANVKDTTGSEKTETGTVQEIDTVIFTTRWIEGISAKMRIAYNGKIYNIRSVAEIGRRKFLVFKTESRDNG